MTSFNRKSAFLLAALGAVLLIGLAGCGGDEPAPPPPAPPPFRPQTISVTLGEHGGTVQFQTTQAGGFTMNNNPFASGSTVSGENGKTYRVTLTGTTGTAEFVRAEQVRLRLGNSGEGLLIDENEDGTYTGTLAASFEETTFESGELVATSKGVNYRLTLEEGSWSAVFVTPDPVEITLGASGYPIELVMTEDGGYTLNGNQFRSGDIVTTPTDSRYRLTLVNDEWQYAYVPPDPIRVSLGTSGEVALLMRQENGSYELNGSVVMSGDVIQANNGNRYRIRFQAGMWTAAFVQDPPVLVALGASGLQVSLARQEDGSYRYGNEVVRSGGMITASNGSQYRLTLANGAWTATFVPPRAIQVLLGLSGELANIVQLEDGTFEVNGQPLGPDSTVMASNGNAYRVMRVNGTWSAVFMPPDPVSVPLGTSGRSLLITRQEDGTWLGNGSPISSGVTVPGPGGTQYQLVLQGSRWSAVWLPTAPVALVLGTSGEAVVITQVEDGTYRANGDPVASGSVLTARNGSRYQVTFQDGQWSAMFVAGDPIRVRLGNSGAEATLIRTEDGGFTWNGDYIDAGGTIRAPNGSEYRLAQVNGQWTATYAAPPPVTVMLGMSGEFVTLTRGEDGQWMSPTGMIVRTGSTIQTGTGGQYRLTLADGSWVAEYLPTSQTLTLGTTGGDVTVIREENGQFYIAGVAITNGGTYTASNGNEFRTYLVNGEWRAEFVPTVVRVPAGDTNFIVTLQRLESGTFLYNGEEYQVGEEISYRGVQYTINLSNGVLSLDVESGAIQVPLGNTGSYFTLILQPDGTYQWEDGRPFSSGTRVVQDGFWWQLTLENGEWSAQILAPFDPANPAGPVTPTDPNQPGGPITPTQPTQTDSIGTRIADAGVFGLLASAGATTRGTTGSILAVGPPTNEVQYSINDLVGRGTVTQRLTFVENAQRELQAIIDLIEAYSTLYELEAVDPNSHIAGSGTDSQWNQAKEALNRVSPTFGTRLDTPPWTGTLTASEVGSVIAELQEVITELGSAASIESSFDIGTFSGTAILEAAISQIRFGSSGNTRFAVYSLRGSGDTATTTPATWDVGAFAYSPLEAPSAANLPDRGTATYSGTTLAVSAAGLDVGTLYTGSIELSAQFSRRRVTALVTGLQTSSGVSWQHASFPTEAIRLPQATFAPGSGAFTGSGAGMVRYPAQYGGEVSVAGSVLTGQVLSDGREIMGTWSLGGLLQAAYGTPRTATGSTPRPTINDQGDGALTWLTNKPAPDAVGNITFNATGIPIVVDASSLYSRGSDSQTDPTFVSAAASALGTQEGILRSQRTTLDSATIEAAWNAVGPALATIFDAVPVDYDIAPPTTTAAVDNAVSLVSRARAAMGSQSAFLNALGPSGPFTGEIQGLDTPPSFIAELFAARPRVFQARSGRTNYTRFGAWSSAEKGTASMPDVILSDVYAYSPLAQTGLTEAPSFRATYEGETRAVRTSDGALFGGNFQLVVDWTTTNNSVTAFARDLRNLSDNSWLQYSDQDVEFILFSSVTVPSDGRGLNAPSPSASIRYRDIHLPQSNVSTVTMGGKFVGNGDDGPFGVIGQWSISLEPSSAGMLNGAFGADLIP